MQTFFSASVTRFFKKPSDQLWNNKSKMLFSNYPWFQKNTIKAEWPSFSQLSYVNNEVRSEDTFLKIPNQTTLSPRREESRPISRVKNTDKTPSATRFLAKMWDNTQIYFDDNFLKPLENLKPSFASNSTPHQNVGWDSNKTSKRLWQPNLESNLGFPSFEYVLEGSSKMQKKNFYVILDNLSYRMMGIGFPLFTLGILSGAVWANEAWGSYWSWDIKEVGSFINWLLVALYFHCRYKNFISLSHVVAFISLMVLFFNFFGISLGIFGSSLHAYGASS